MKYRSISTLLLLVFLASCRAPLAMNRVETGKNISLTQDLPEDQNFLQIIAPYKKELESIMNTKISYTDTDLNKQGDNSNLGNLLADFVYEGANEWAAQNKMPEVDGAVINIGGIRTSIGVGDILTKHIYQVMPFENEVVIVKLTGEQMQGLFDYYLSTQKNNPVSHLLIETERGQTLTHMLINGKPADKTKTYHIATSDYLALGGDSMNFFSKGEMTATGIKMRDLFLEKFKANPVIKAPSDLRLIFKNKPNK